MVLMTRASLPAKNIAEYIAYARANPGKVTFGTAGPGSITHLSGEWIHGVTNTKVTYVAYKATPPQILDMLGDRLDIIEAGIVTALPLIKSGKLGALAVSTKQRSKLLPELPTVAEQGIPGFDVSLWMGFSAPAGTPASCSIEASSSFSRPTVHPSMAASSASSLTLRASRVAKRASRSHPSAAKRDRASHSASERAPMAIQSSSPAQRYTLCGAYARWRLLEIGGRPGSI